MKVFRLYLGSETVKLEAVKFIQSGQYVSFYKLGADNHLEVVALIHLGPGDFVAENTCVK